MERKFNDDRGVTLECTMQEAADLWFAIERTLEIMDAEGLQEISVYARLKALEYTLNGKN